MEKKICKSCNTEISLLSRITSRHCQNCGIEIHSRCINAGLEYESFTEGIIKHYKNWCKICAEKNSIKFNEQRYCSCNADITTMQIHAKCSICGAIGHEACFSKNLKEALRTLGSVAPFKGDTAGLYCCKTCKTNILINHEEIMSRYTTWIDGTERDEIKGYKITRRLEIVKSDLVDVTSPLELKEALKYAAIGQGGNAFINFHWDKHESRTTSSVIDGYGPKGYPHYAEIHNTRIWYTGTAMAVFVELINEGEKKDANDDRLLEDAYANIN